mmetsp:Transcript_52031/g.117499  ORF Transcript_52031/g.117499 Transcript_52031/m.117499 type:complete len:202 (+) Transcript_52031:111-716(+)
MQTKTCHQQNTPQACELHPQCLRTVTPIHCAAQAMPVGRSHRPWPVVSYCSQLMLPPPMYMPRARKLHGAPGLRATPPWLEAALALLQAPPRQTARMPPVSALRAAVTRQQPCWPSARPLPSLRARSPPQPSGSRPPSASQPSARPPPWRPSRSRPWTSSRPTSSHPWPSPPSSRPPPWRRAGTAAFFSGSPPSPPAPRPP